MEATRARHATVDDLLERVLDKGIILNLDLVIGMAGIPLIGVNLRAAIAAIETMIEYGFMKDWDEDLRRFAAREARPAKLALAPGEAVELEMYGSHWYSDGIYRAWRPGRLYLTDRRLVLYRQDPAEVLFQTPLAEIRDWIVTEETHFTDTRRDLLCLALATDEVASLYAEDIARLRQALAAKVTPVGDHGNVTPLVKEKEINRLIAEKMVADGKLWYQAPDAGTHGATWRPGWLHLTVERLLWWSDFDRRVGWEIRLPQVQEIHLDTRDLGGMLGNREVLSIGYQGSQGPAEALFSGQMLAEWERQIKEQTTDDGRGGFHAGH